MKLRTASLIVLAILFSQPARAEVRVLKLDDGRRFAMGKVDSRRLLHPEMGARLLTLNYSVFEPGVEFPQHVHPRSDDIFLVLQGQCDVRQGDRRTPLLVGQAVFIPAGQIHGGTATGEGTSILISFQAPPDEVLYTGQRDSSRPGAAQPQGQITLGAVKFADFDRRNGVFFGPEQGSNKVTAAYWKLGPGEKLDAQNVTGAEQFLFLWKGRLKLTAAEEQPPTLAAERDTVFLRGQATFQAANPGPGEAIVIQVTAHGPGDWQGRNPIRTVFKVSEEYTWLREPLLRRLPDGSLCCVFFSGGRGDGDRRNLVAAIRSDDDGQTWSKPEVLREPPDRGAWAPSMLTYRGKAYLFWFTKTTGFRDLVNYLAATGNDGRTFREDRRILAGWNAHGGIDVRHAAQFRNGRVLLPIAWQEPLDATDSWTPSKQSVDLRNVGGEVARQRIYYVGVMEPNASFTEFTRHGRISKKTPNGPTPSVPLFENAIADLGDDRLAMLIRADTTNRLWRSDSNDGGRTWSEPRATNIPNPGSKPRVLNLPDGRIVLFHNPSEKDFADKSVHHHAFRTPLEMWISADRMQSWPVKKTVIAAPKVAMYPDAFYDADEEAVYLCFEDGRTISLLKIEQDELK